MQNPSTKQYSLAFYCTQNTDQIMSAQIISEYLKESEPFLKEGVIEEWLDRMIAESRSLDPMRTREFLSKYSRKAGCPFDVVIFNSDCDGIYLTVNNIDQSTKTKRPMTSPQALRKRLRATNNNPLSQEITIN